ncbi:hypothetical protein N0V82_006534 [Gnomoniopsis sp. IMI 355080]|nr:hypothetical protein N0V82_006534 [Gnomoniopsis sp. IMI 355080]
MNGMPGADNGDRNSFSNIGRHFLAELLKLNHDLLFSVFDENYSQQNMEPVLKKVKDIEALLRTAILNCPSVYIVIDGIDECPREDRKTIVRWFRELVENLKSQDQERIRCLFVSQDDGPARRDFSGMVSLKIEPSDNYNDIESFAVAESRRIQREFDLDAALAADIATKIPVVACGMFLLARLIVSNLMDQVDAEQIEVELEDGNLPKKLDEAFVVSGRCANIEAAAAHLSLASLSIDYLNLSGFKIDCPVDKSLISTGFYGFMDYAVANWIRHVEKGVDGKSKYDQSNPGITGLTESLEVFLDIHFMSTVSETRLPPVSKGNERRLRVFESQAFYSTLHRVVILLRKELNFHGRMKDFEIPLDLTEAVSRIRTVLEKVYMESLSDQTSNDTLISIIQMLKA